jgi:hypothetical protein
LLNEAEEASDVHRFMEVEGRCGVVFLVAVTAFTPSVATAQSAPAVLGKTIGEWSATWWLWALAIPAATNPLLHDDSPCDIGQQGPVWFLGGVLFNSPVPAERSCAIPNGRRVLFPIANSFWINSALDDPRDTEEDYRQFANDFLPPSIGGELEATLDGHPIVFYPATPITRAQSPVFTARFPQDNIFGLDPQLLTGYPIVSDGFWVMLPPLVPGPHILHFRAGTSQDVTYHLTVGKP